MAVTVNQASGYIEMTEAGDEVARYLNVKSVRFVSETGQLAADVIQLVDPQATSEVLWENYGVADPSVEEATGEKAWRNGVRLETLTGDRGKVHISYR